jgi:hypothetical protein
LSFQKLVQVLKLNFSFYVFLNVIEIRLDNFEKVYSLTKN